MKDNKSFWRNLQKLVDKSKIVIDRPKGSKHPKFPDAPACPLDYGFLKDTSSMDGTEIDVFVGSLKSKNVSGILCTIDMMKKDSEIKILIDCTKTEMNIAYEHLNNPEFFKAILVKKPNSLMHSLTIFPSFEIEKTADYYVQKLGFSKVEYLNCKQSHICLYCDEVEIVLTKADKPIIPNRKLYGYGYDAYFITQNFSEFQNQFLKNGVKIVKFLNNTDYQNSEFMIEDIDGRYIAFGVKEEKSK
jgi:inorganic pyrophosphatase